MPSSRRALSAYVAVVIVCAFAFALYAPSVRLMPLHDDAHIIARIHAVSLLDIFKPESSGGVEYRPAGTMFWILTRDLFGWFVPGLLHFWNVLFHVLNVALVAALVKRLMVYFRDRPDQGNLTRPPLIAALFALFPLSYQAVIAGGIYHPAMLLFGLAAVHAYLHFRQQHTLIGLAVCMLTLAAACLSHEAGFMFGPLIALVEVVIALSPRISANACLHRRPQHDRPRTGVEIIGRVQPLAGALAFISLLYPVGYRLLVNTMWTPARGMLTSDTSGVLDKLLYYTQGLAWWVIAPLRPLFGSFELNTPSRVALILGTVGLIALGLGLARRGGQLRLALFGLVWWLITLAPLVAALPLNYVTDTPRLMYVPSVGLAFFWGAALTPAIARSRRFVLNRAPLVIAGIMLAWSTTYISARLEEVTRLTPAFKLIGTHLEDSPPDLKVALVNPPFLLVPVQPSFLFGREGFSLWEPNPGYGPVGNWLAATTGNYRTASAVRHIASLTDRNPYTDEPDKSFTLGRGDGRFKYGVFAPAVDDPMLRQTMLASDLTFRFDYDAPGLRLRRVARVQPITARAGVQPMATFAPTGAAIRAGALVELISGSTARCDGHVRVTLAWHNRGGPFEPTAVFVHGIDAQGQQLFAADKDLLDGVLPINALPRDLLVTETREIADPTSSAQVQQVRVGLYSLSDATRFAATRAEGGVWAGGEVILSVTEDGRGANAVCGE